MKEKYEIRCGIIETKDPTKDGTYWRAIITRVSDKSTTGAEASTVLDLMMKVGRILNASELE